MTDLIKSNLKISKEFSGLCIASSAPPPPPPLQPTIGNERCFARKRAVHKSFGYPLRILLRGSKGENQNTKMDFQTKCGCL